jgi:GNAT superfamily N-acetyltransferase
VAPGKAEVAFTVVDRYQGRGIGASLVWHLAIVAREAGLDELIAEVLPENKSMLRLFQRSGLPVSVVAEPEVVHVTMQLR